MKPFIHRDLDGIIDSIFVKPENAKEKNQLTRISKATKTTVKVTDTSIPEQAVIVEIEIRIKPSYNSI
jgi:hypothetical protein